MYERNMKDYHADAEFAHEFCKKLIDEKADAVFSYDYFPLISDICNINNVPYLSWIYDCPMNTLLSYTVSNSTNYIFCFDKMYADRLRESGRVKNCIYFPLGGNTDLKLEIESRQKYNNDLADKYSSDISFLGNFYNDSKNRLRFTKLTPYADGYIEGMIQAQLKIYGYNFIREIIPEKVAGEVIEKCCLKLGDLYRCDITQLAADAISMEVSAREREEVIYNLSRYGNVKLYTSSVLPERLEKANIICMGYADYYADMPYIFYNSKININITSKTIRSGIPLRVFDILSCGGFCITNYQREISEFFDDGKDIVMYSDIDDLCSKVRYYLEHDEERNEIAQRGYEKMKSKFELRDRITQMFSMVAEDIINGGDK